VWGVRHRKDDARAFCNAVKDADKDGLEYGVALAPQPDNSEDPNAIAVLGQCMMKPWFRAPRLKEWHVGYVRRDLANELHVEFLSKGVPIASELYEIFEQRDFYEIKFFVLAPQETATLQDYVACRQADRFGSNNEPGRRDQAVVSAWVRIARTRSDRDICRASDASQPRPQRSQSQA
jgi:hypothetical protein